LLINLWLSSQRPNSASQRAMVPSVSSRSKPSARQVGSWHSTMKVEQPASKR